MNLDDALQTFITEGRELLRDMEAALLECEQGPVSAETVNTIFRAAHTIKGSSGLFGLDAIVSFTHEVESALDRVREGTLSLGSELAAVLVDCRDHMAALVESVAQGGAGDEPALASRGAELLVRVREVAGAPLAEAHAAVSSRPPPRPTESATAAGAGATGTDCWHISVRPGAVVLRNGMDPLSILRYLKTLGELVSVTVVDDALPSPDRLDPEVCYLGFELRYRTTVDKARIEAAFEFVRDDCSLHILPPRSSVADYIRLIHELPEDDQRLGELLVRCGALTERELAQGLRAQAESSSVPGDGPPPPLGELLVEQKLVLPPVLEAALEKQREVRAPKTPEAQSLRVDADKLDRLIDSIGELVIAGGGATLLAKAAGLGALQEAASRLTRLVEEVRGQALELRMVPIGPTFTRFQRVVRDVSRELGKDVRLEVSGAETELDKALVERISDPLMHMVRNAMDHGIEDAATRARSGKSAQATVRLNAYHDAGAIVIEVSDDGGGLPREKIVKKALERGLISEGQPLSDREVYALVFEPGFSTADRVTNLSGRGVGMDVVKRNITALRGTVELDSQPGRGTTVRIRLPLTLAIIDGFLVGVGRSTFVIPLDVVEECVEFEETGRADQGAHDYFDLRGAVLPFVRLRGLFALEGKASRRESVVVVRSAGQRAGFVVDELLGELQAVIKPLSPVFNHLECLAGSTVLGNGAVALVLDAPALLHRVEADGSPSNQRGSSRGVGT